MISRRNFLTTAGIAAGGMALPAVRGIPSPAAASGPLGTVKIVDVKTAAIDIRYKTHLVKITTDSGLHGLGEAFPKAEVADDIHAIKKQVIGRDPLQVECLLYALTEQYASRGSYNGELCGAIAGIETALWDLAGKILGVPVYTLLGGAYRDRILLYNDTDSPAGDDPKAWAEMAVRSKELGYRAVKHSLPSFKGPVSGIIPAETLRKWTRIMEETRSALGPEFPIGIDLHWKYQAADIVRFTRMIEDLDVWFLEDPIRAGDIAGLAQLKAESRVPLLTGENLYSRDGFRPLIESQASDLIHIDAQKSGGLLEMKKIADWASIYSMPMLCHNGSSPVGTIASAHACAAIRSFVALETDTIESSKAPWWADIVQHEGPLYRDGHLLLSKKPGLGITLNEDVCRAHLADERGFFV